MCKVEKRWVEAKREREWKTETLTWQVRQTARQAGRQAGKVSAFIHTNYKFNLTLIFFVLQWLLPSYHLWNFWAQPAWWVVLHFLLMITHCQCFLPTVFLSLSVVLFALSLLLLLFSVRVEFFSPGFCTLPVQVYLWKVYLKFQLSSSVSFRCIYYCLALLFALLCLFACSAVYWKALVQKCTFPLQLHD